MAVDTLVLMSAKGRDAAAQYSMICLQLLVAETGLVARKKLLSLGADNIGHFDGRLCHECRGL